MRVCTRPTEAACLCLRKCANNCQLIVAGILRFLRHECAAHFRVIHTRKTPYVLRIYANTDWHIFRSWKREQACVSYMRMKSVLL